MKTRKSYLSESEGSELAIRIRNRNKKILNFSELNKRKTLDCEFISKGLNKNFPQLLRNGTIGEFFSVFKNCKDLKDLHFLVKSLRKMLCFCSIQYVQFIDQDVLKILINHLDIPKMAENVLWCFINLTVFDCKPLVGLGIIEKLVKFSVKCSDDKILDLIIWALSNIAGDCVDFRDLVIKAKGTKAFFSGLFKKLCKKNSIWGISNLCKGKPAPEYQLISKILKKIENFFGNEDTECMVSICEIIFACTGHDDFVFTGQFWVQKILNLTEDSNLGFISLKILSNLSMKSNNIESYLIQNDIFCKTIRFFKGNNIMEQKEALLLVNNLCAGGKQCIEAFIKHKVFKLSLGFLNSENFELKNGAISVIENISSNVHGQILFVNSEYFAEFLKIFKIMNPDFVVSALSAMHQLMSNPRVREEFIRLDGKCLIEGLKDHPNKIIPLMAAEFLEFHFNHNFS